MTLLDAIHRWLMLEGKGLPFDEAAERFTRIVADLRDEGRREGKGPLFQLELMRGDEATRAVAEVLDELRNKGMAEERDGRWAGIGVRAAPVEDRPKQRSLLDG